jgi:hypothetical protein
VRSLAEDTYEHGSFLLSHRYYRLGAFGTLFHTESLSMSRRARYNHSREHCFCRRLLLLLSKFRIRKPVDYGDELMHSVAIAGTIGSPSPDCNKSLRKRSIEATTAVTTQKERISTE